MGNSISRSLVSKSVLIGGACLLFLPLLAKEPEAGAIEQLYSTQEKEIYWAAWNMDFSKADSLLAYESKSASYFVLKSLNTTIRLLIEGDKILYFRHKLLFEKWSDSLERCAKDNRYFHASALLKLHRSLLKVSFGENLSGGMEMRQAYLQFKKNAARPRHLFEDEVYEGAFLAALSTIPDNYQWAAQLVGLQGDEMVGFAKMQKVERSNLSTASYEAKIFIIVIKNYLQYPRQEILAEASELSTYPSSKVMDLLCVWLFNKNNASQEAFKLLEQNLSTSHFPYLDYLRGVTYFQLLELDAAENCLLRYLEKTKSANYKKDSFYKLSLMSQLEGNKDEALRYREKVKKLGTDAYYVDKVASKRVYESTAALPLDFVRAKIAFEGGLFETSIHCLFRLRNEVALSLERDYLLARNYELIGGKLQATNYYKKVVSQCPKEGNYKGPMSCLHLAEMAREEGKKPLAAHYLSQIEDYRDYEHKSSIQHKVSNLKKVVHRMP